MLLFLFILYSNVYFTNGKSILLRTPEDSKPSIVYHPCFPDLFVYMNKHVYVGKNVTSGKNINPLHINESLLKLFPDKTEAVVSAAKFLRDDNVVFIVNNKLAIYNMKHKSFKFVGLKNKQRFDSLSTYVCCNASAVWCQKYSCILSAYRFNSITTDEDIIFSSNCSVNNMQFLRLNLSDEMSALVIIASMESLAAFVSYDNHIAIAKYIPFGDLPAATAYRFNVYDNNLLGAANFPGQDDFLLIWAESAIFYSISAGQIVLPLNIYQIDPQTKNINRVTQFQLSGAFVMNSAGEFTFLTLNGDLIFGVVSLHTYALMVENVTKPASMEVLFISNSMSIKLLEDEMENEVLKLKAESVERNNLFPDNMMKCTTSEFELSLAVDDVYLDKSDSLEIIAKHVHKTGFEHNLVVTVSMATSLKHAISTVSTRKNSVTGLTEDILNIKLKINEEFKKQHKPQKRNHPLAVSRAHIFASKEPIGCKEKVHEVAHVSIGCPAQRRLVVKNNQELIFCNKFKKNSYTLNIKHGPLTSTHYSKERYPFASVTSDGSIEVVYNFTMFGCPLVTSLLQPVIPVVHLYDGNKDLGPIDGDFTVFSIFGHADYIFVLNPVEAGCSMAPQSWSRMMRTDKDPRVAWTGANYVPCYINQNHVTGAEEVGITEDYEIINSTNGNGISILSTSDQLVFFELVLLDPTSSFCDLRTNFAVHNVYSLQVWNTWAPSVVCLCFLLLCLIILIAVFFYCRLQLVERIFRQPKSDEWDDMSDESQEL